MQRVCAVDLRPYPSQQAQVNRIWHGAPFSLSPLAIRAFMPVFDGLWRGSPFRRLRLAETPPHPEFARSARKFRPLPASGER
jgi:hypothetical protein